MESIRYITDSFKGKLLRSQIVVFAVCALITLAIVILHGRLAVLQWRERHPAAQAQAQATTNDETATAPSRSTATPSRPPQAQAQATTEPQEEPTAAPVVAAATPPPTAPLTDHAAVSTEELGSEVSRVVPTLFRWQPVAVDPAQMRDYSGAGMEEMEGWKSSTFSRNATDRWRMPDVPVLAGHYQRGRVARSNWPRPGSLAVELTPLDTDPTAQAGPWRVVLFIASTSETAAQAIMYAGTYTNEKLTLGKASLPAVPVAKERIGTDGTTFYAVVPVAQATATIGGVKVTQSFSASTTTPTSNGLTIPAGNGFR